MEYGSVGVLDEYIPNHKYQMVRQAHHPEPSRSANNNDQNSKFQTCLLFWSLKLGTHPQGGVSGGPILEFEICL